MSRAAQIASTRSWLASVAPEPEAVTVNRQDQGYRLGRLDRATRTNNPPALSGDTAVMGSADLMHRRITDGTRNNATIRKLREAIPDLVIGTGMQTLADPFEPWVDLASLTPEEFDLRLSYALESDELYAEWFLDPKQFSVDGKTAGPDLQRMVIAELVRCGSCLIVESVSPATSADGMPLAYQILEREQLDATKDTLGGDGQNRIVNGIEFDAYGREVAFWIFDNHPDDAFGSGSVTSRRVDASRVMHVVRPDRPSDHVGATWLAAIGQVEVDRDKFLTSELQTAAKGAAVALVHKKANPQRGSNMGLADGLDSTDVYGNTDLKLGSTPMAAVIGVDEDLKIVESNRPNSGAEPFLKMMDRYTAAGSGVSYYTVSGNYEATSFSSAKAAQQDEDRHFAPIQQWFARLVAVPMRRRFNAMAVGLGRLSTVSATEYKSNRRRYDRFEAMGAGRDLLDPEAETNAAVGRLRAGLSTLKIECARRGLHWVRVLRQIALENRVSEVLGVVLDFSKGQGGQVTSNTRSASDQGAAA